MLQHVLTVPQAARRTRRNAETIRRWIREGKLPARKVGAQHVIEEADLEGFLGGEVLPGFSPHANEIVAILRDQRSAH
jgi:excisionase family DNA binding protein